ncbi:DNA-binding protein [Jeotgalibacillus alimentarius]|uniref:diadenylate cyclase n=1 Tax=Jeotgalibacillus alimentarius TaxID=135826 RepID=A0A0C2WC39_9BACL|nr:DNA integrity scanning diadenylate cyclase DisA [Jeotgalibacillus alimentarius]KIL53593.1 DNA-binding protein [Jeotgalibacillus alimentarius]
MDNRRRKRPSADIIQLVAPGTPFREGIDNVLRAGTGGLIVVGCNDKMKPLVDGGFQIHCPFSPTYLYELAKMDGAIILNESGSKILIANAQLNPSPMVPSSETGMRHRTAERVARETDSLVIAISQRRNVITLYKGTYRYALKEIAVILAKANQALQTLEKYRTVLDQSLSHLTLLEYEEAVTYNDVLQVIHRFEMVIRIKNELLLYLNELGSEGRLVRLQLNELLADLEKEAVMVIRDYASQDHAGAHDMYEAFAEKVSSKIMEDESIMKMLGHPSSTEYESQTVPRGYRVLNKIPRLPLTIIENIIGDFGTLDQLKKATVEELDQVDGIGGIRARKIKEGLKSVREQSLADH